MVHDNRARLKKKLANGEKVFAAWTSIGDPQITEAFAQTNIDFVGIDIEHGTISFKECQRIIAAAQAYGKSCLPRIDSHSMPMIKRLLDSGADGIIAPMVESADQVADLISWIKYPPIGNRSFGVNRAQNYGHDFDTYVQGWNASSSLILQIESVTGIKNIASILDFPEVDGVMVGAYDLSGSMGLPGEINHPDVIAAAKTVYDHCKKINKSSGIHLINPTASEMQTSFEAGANFLILSSDVFLLKQWGEDIDRAIEQSR